MARDQNGRQVKDSGEKLLIMIFEEFCYLNGFIQFRLQQGFLLSATHQLVDKLVSETQETISLQNSESSGVQRLLEDAENCKQLLPKLQDAVRCDPHPIEVRLSKMTNELSNNVKTYLEVRLNTRIII